MFSRMKYEQIKQAYEYYKMEEIPLVTELTEISPATLDNWHEYEYLPKLKAHSDRNHIIDVYVEWCESNVKKATTSAELEDAKKILAEWKEFARLHSDKMQAFINHAAKYFRYNYTRNDEGKFCKITWGEKHEVILIPV